MSQVFAFQNRPVRTLTENSETWFAAVDVCRALGIDWSGKTLAAIPSQWQGMGKLPTPRGGGSQRLKIISEPAVYKLAFRSNKPEADAFTNWVASEVLPSIRQTGAYELSGHRCKSALEGQNGAPTLKQLAWQRVNERALPPAPDAHVELESHFQRIRSLVREINEHERSIYAIIKDRRGDILKTLDARYNVYVNMHTVMDRMFFSIDYAIEAAEAHAKSMCVMCRV